MTAEAESNQVDEEHVINNGDENATHAQMDQRPTQETTATTEDSLPSDSQEISREQYSREAPYWQNRPGAVAVAGPDAEQPGGASRTITSKHILAERLQHAAERAVTEDEDAPPADSREVRPGAIAVAGPDADDGRNQVRMVTPKHLLAERLQQMEESTNGDSGSEPNEEAISTESSAGGNSGTETGNTESTGDS